MTAAARGLRVELATGDRWTPVGGIAAVSIGTPTEPTPPPHGPRAARQVAQQLARQGAHSHLVVDGTDHCASGHCHPYPVLTGVMA